MTSTTGSALATRTPETEPGRPAPRTAKRTARRARSAARRRAFLVVAAAGSSYLFIAFLLWWHAWSAGASTHTLCGCGDPALFLWFFQWPATAVAHLHNPLFSSALAHPGGVNLLAQTSVLGLSVPLIPVTWIFGPVAALNVASTLTPAISAFVMFIVLRRWVRWAPAAYVGGLLFGFSPFVLGSLESAHLMTAAVMLLPAILAVLDDILIRHAHDPRRAGLLLGALLTWQFFLSTEILAILAVLLLFSLLGLLVYTVAFERHGLRGSLRPAVTGLLVAAATGGLLLTYPAWFALAGPAHLSGRIWPNLNTIGGFVGSSFVTPATNLRGSKFLSAIGGYAGSQLPSAAYAGWGLISVLAVGSLLWWRDRRLQFFAFLLALSVVFSFGVRTGQWMPDRLLDRLPVLQNVIEQRFILVGYLAAAVMLAVIADHARTGLPRLLKWKGAKAWAAGSAAGLGAAAVALTPIAVTFAPTLPFTMQAVVLPRWYTTVAPKLPPGRVLLSYPAPFSGIQVSMAWQAVDDMVYSQAGVGGPQGVAARAGPARAGFSTLVRLTFPIAVSLPTGTPEQLAAVRHAIATWRVNTVVIAPQDTTNFFVQGTDPTYAAAFMTAALGRLPRIEEGAWVWNDVTTVPSAPALGHTAPTLLAGCVAQDKKDAALVPRPATLQVARCVLAGATR